VFMIFYRFYASKGGTKQKLVIFLGRINLLPFIYCRNMN
jgi:hypothetical protein